MMTQLGISDPRHTKRSPTKSARRNKGPAKTGGALVVFRGKKYSMKSNIRSAVVLVLWLGATLARPDGNKTGAGQAAAGASEEISTAAKAAAASGCDAELWNHVYHKGRLRVIQSCIAVTGTIRRFRKEADGDLHIQLAVDPQFAKLLNGRNKTALGNTLLLEPICQVHPTQADAVAACRNFHFSVARPKVGDKVRVVGSYVNDSEAGWMEIHPVSSIAVQH
jgi:hypothetical protein